MGLEFVTLDEVATYIITVFVLSDITRTIGPHRFSNLPTIAILKFHVESHIDIIQKFRKTYFKLITCSIKIFNFVKSIAIKTLNILCLCKIKPYKYLAFIIPHYNYYI